jgi:methionyl-tRNA formyltransferase
MRIVFMGTGEIAIPAFQALLQQKEVVGLVTQPDRPTGRRHHISTPPEIKKIAQKHNITVLQPESLSEPFSVDALRKLKPDLIVVMAYGQILSQEVIDMAPMGCINAHASLLPRHRGAACIQSTIKEGDKEAGVTIMHIVRRLDAGDIIAQISQPLDGTETGGSLHNMLSQLTPEILLFAITAIEKGTATRVPQQECLATYAGKLKRSDGNIDWMKSAEEIGRMIRAYDPWPGTYTYYKNRHGKIRNMKVFSDFSIEKGDPDALPGQVISASDQGLLIACGEGALLFPEVQLEGSKRMKIKDLIPGHPGMKTTRFASVNG